MECEATSDEHYDVEPPLAATRPRALKRKLGDPDVGDVQLGVATAVPGADTPDQVHITMEPCHPPQNNKTTHRVPGVPFMNNMDEITYWIYTKRAPCLMNYDNLIKKQNGESKLKSIGDNVPSPKKKKRKLSLLDDDDAISMNRQQNVFFEASHQNKCPMLASCKSDTGDSDIDFNIKNSSIQVKPKRMKLQKNSRTTVHKKNKVVTSTPKTTTALRRSLRKAQNGFNNNSHLNISFEISNPKVAIVNDIKGNIKCEKKKSIDKTKKSSEKLINGDHSGIKKESIEIEQEKKPVQNGQFEDLSDVSGFTANYIRSTKLNGKKSSRNLRSKSSRTLIKESKQNPNKEDDTMLICVNKSVNTAAELNKSALLNCSTGSSQNVINLITVQNDDKCTKIHKSTSLLKFMDPKTRKTKESETNKLIDCNNKRKPTNQVNISFLSRSSSTSRYPKRYNISSYDIMTAETTANQLGQETVDKKRRAIKNVSEFNNSDRKENPEEQSVSRTRSGRSIGLKVRQPENSVLVVSNSTDPISSVAMNVAISNGEDQPGSTMKKKKRISCVKYVSGGKQTMNKSGISLRRESLRDRSGFTACFSDSDEDSEPLKQRKFFC